MGSVSIIFLNCQCLGNLKKVRDVFLYLRQKKNINFFKIHILIPN